MHVPGRGWTHIMQLCCVHFMCLQRYMHACVMPKATKWYVDDRQHTPIHKSYTSQQTAIAKLRTQKICANLSRTKIENKSRKSVQRPFPKKSIAIIPVNLCLQHRKPMNGSVFGSYMALLTLYFTFSLLIFHPGPSIHSPTSIHAHTTSIHAFSVSLFPLFSLWTFRCDDSPAVTLSYNIEHWYRYWRDGQITHHDNVALHPASIEQLLSPFRLWPNESPPQKSWNGAEWHAKSDAIIKTSDANFNQRQTRTIVAV